MDALTFLSGHAPLFAALSQEELTELAVNSVLRQYAAGKTVIHAGMSVDGLQVIATGKAEVYAKVAGKGLVRVADLGPGEVFGEVSMVEKTMSAATVKAGPDGTYVLVIPEAPFCRLVSENEAFGARVRALIQSRRAASSKS
jgi:CRP-like cAMP-binding protein